MLAAFLPSWLQDLSGAAAALKTMHSVSLGSMLPLLLVVPVAILALLLARRSDNLNRRARRAAAFDALAAETVERRAARPAADAGLPAPAGRRPAAVPLPPRGPVRREEAPLVLIVDDSSVVRAKLSRVLAGAQLRVVEAGDGRQALDLIEAGLRPAVLITDLEMPGLDGFGLIAAVHGSSATERLPIVAITAHDDLQARIADLGGIYGIFKKPWNDQALLRRIRTLTVLSGTDAETGGATVC